eukprot:CAMPEP_0182590820 /NCGR_PEP_ID=MMETSP1324-20130603/72445_1 /TAXON_ID=236786 /ORGANISM="Florenciella sp., Strain RCC1587" /LENGTH=43 /DNA_ID= /DNA_START= /DNA_END= /DNA_ORIENTATION=
MKGSDSYDATSVERSAIAPFETLRIVAGDLDGGCHAFAEAAML